MPRAGARARHNNRQEGLVGPGKRLTKQKSNGQLTNGIPRGPLSSDVLPSTATADSSVNSSSSAGNRDPLPTSNSDSSAGPTDPALKTRDSESATDGHAQENARNWEAANGTSMATSRRSDAQLTKPKLSQDVSALQIASTILKSRPAYDTIALLIVLLALPPMMLTIVQALFASLTLVPGGLSPISFLSVFDVFQGSAGSPSLGVMAWVDLICFGLWICLWNWAQNFALDLAQIHIAMTLGNGSSGKNGSANTVCFAIVLLLHTARSRGVRRFVTTTLFPSNILSQTRLAGLVNYMPSDAEFGDTPAPPSKVRSLFAIHIISQALISFVRRRVASTQTVPATKSSKRVETEAMATTQDVSGTDLMDPSTTATSVDFQPPPTPGLRDSKEKGVNAKKRRRQANSVRSRQPFWAALASTKVHVLREVEHNKGLPNVATPQTGPFDNLQQDAVWITHVDPSSIQFEATFHKIDPTNQESPLPDEYRPFYVRINGARWHTVSIEPIDRESLSEGSQAQWIGEISGLAPNCTYTCSFIAFAKDEELGSVMVKTPAIDEKDVPQSLTSAPVRQSTRPSSPTTTLKNSIASGEAKLNEARKRLNQLKKQHKSGLSKADREVEALSGRLKSGADDTKLRQKLLQTERNIRQTEDSASSIKSALDTLETVPEDETVEYKSRKQEYEKQKALLGEANATLAKAKSEADQNLSCINGELNQIMARKDRIQVRQGKLNEQHDRITQANAQGMNEKERREAESNRRQQEQQRREKELQSHINHMRQEFAELQAPTQAHWREIEVLEKQDMAQRQKMMMSAGPHTPEGDLPGTRPQPQSARPYAFGSFTALPNNALGPEPQASPFLAYANTLPTDGRRPRSDTNRSIGAMSNFSAADFEDADPIPPMPIAAEYQLNGRKGSGSSRGKNNGSPAGVIGDGLRSPSQRGNGSPGQVHGHLPGSTTW